MKFEQVFGIDSFNQAIKRAREYEDHRVIQSITSITIVIIDRDHSQAPSSCQGRTSEEEKAVRVKVTVPWWAKRGEKGKGVDPRSVKVKSEVTEGESRWCVVEVLVKLVLLMNFRRDA